VSFSWRARRVPRRHEDAARCVGQHRAIDDDAAALRADQPGDRIDQRGLARSRAAEQRGQAGAALESRVENEIAEARWFAWDDAPDLPPSISISRRLIASTIARLAKEAP
jgi:hypothetical protein